MLGAHRLTKLAAALTIGLGTVFSWGAAASAAEGAVYAPAPLQLASPDGPDGTPIRSGTAFRLAKAPAIAAIAVADTRAGTTGGVGGATGDARTPAGLFDLDNKAPHGQPNGLLGLSEGGAVAHAFADIPAAPKLLLTFGQEDAAQVEYAQLPIPGTVWLFLAALALLFGISHRQNRASR